METENPVKKEGRKMKYTSMTRSQKEAICDEATNRKARQEDSSLPSLARWAKEKFKLPATPGVSTISRIMKKHRTRSNNSSAVRSCNLTRARNGESHAVETALFAWICDQYKRREKVSSRLIQGRATHLQEVANSRRQPSERTKLSFSDGWLNRFKKRWGLLVSKPKGEDGEDNVSAADASLTAIRSKLQCYAKKDIFNAAECAINYKMAPDTSMLPPSTPGTEPPYEDRITLLVCCNADGSEKFELLMVGSSLNPQSFGRQTAHELGLNYDANHDAWMTNSLFFEWLVRFDAHIGRSPGRRVGLLVDSCSAHGTVETAPSLGNVDIIFIPPNTTTCVQPCNSGIISTIKVRYRSFQLDRALDLIDENVRDIYKVEVLTAMRSLKRIWNEMPSTVIANSWRASKFLHDDPNLLPTTTPSDTETADRTYLQDRFHELVPEPRRIPFESLIHSKGEDNCIQSVGDNELMCHVVAEVADCRSDQDSDGPEASLPSLNEQLKALAVVKRIAVAHHGDEVFLSGLRRLQTALRVKKAGTAETPKSTNADGKQDGHVNHNGPAISKGTMPSGNVSTVGATVNAINPNTNRGAIHSSGTAGNFVVPNANRGGSVSAAGAMASTIVRDTTPDQTVNSCATGNFNVPNASPKGNVISAGAMDNTIIPDTKTEESAHATTDGTGNVVTPDADPGGDENTVSNPIAPTANVGGNVNTNGTSGT